MIRHGRRLAPLGPFFGYVIAAIAFSWPLAVHLDTHLTGSPAGDTGVYVWNHWVFRHELLDRLQSPFFTDTIFSLSGRVDLGLHNYTAFQNLLALPLIGWLGIVASFNVVYLAMTVLTAYAAFLLARQVTGSAAESWLAGLLFAWSPILVTRGGGHFSLVAAAPIAVFLLLLLRAAERCRLRDAVALGVTCSWAATADAYYGVYCVLLAAMFLLAGVVTIRRRRAEPKLRGIRWLLDVLIFCLAGLVVRLMAAGGWQFTVLGTLTSIRSLYTPMLLLTVTVAARLLLAYRPNVVLPQREAVLRVMRLAAAAGIVATAMLSPVLYAVGVRVSEGRWDQEPIFWRSSPPGVDLAAYVLPNPNHPFAPGAIAAWLTPRADAYFENVASLTFVALVAIAVAWRHGWRVPPLWGGLAIVFGLLALGPFVRIAGFQTQIPGPWAFLRYIPVIGLARTPSRFSVLLMLAVAVLFASALVWLARRWPHRRPAILWITGALLVFELLPAPRPLYSATVPDIYRHIAAEPADVRLLELPMGVRDGTASIGNFTARTQFFQTMHEKRLIGGYLSRVSRRRIREFLRDPMLDALVWLSEGRLIDASRQATLYEEGPAFVDRVNLGFVVVDTERTPPALRQFAIVAFHLQLVDRDGAFELYRPSAQDRPAQ